MLGSPWPIIVLLRRTVYFDASPAKGSEESALTSLLIKVLRPQGRDAKAARAFGLAFVPLNMMAILAFFLDRGFRGRLIFIKLLNNLLIVSFAYFNLL